MKRTVKVQDLQALGLRPYQARVLVALVDAGTANSATLHTASGVPRTSIYKVMDDLIKLGLVHPVQVAGCGPAVWATNGWESVLTQFETNAVADLIGFRDRVRQVQEQVSKAG